MEQTSTEMRASPNQPVHLANRVLPSGYWWRVWVALFLLMGGFVGTALFNDVVGVSMMVAGFAFYWLSGLRRMVQAIKEGDADEDG